jgi:hypothetical protein
VAEDFVGGVQPGGVGIAESGHAWTLSHAAHLAGRGQPLRIIVAGGQASVREGLVLLTHISRIFARTGSRDRAAAIGYAHRHHIG